MKRQVIELSKSSSKEEVVTAPMVGKILEVHVKVGSSVKEGDLLLIFEAMKMENEIYAPISGVVKEIKVSKGKEVNRGDPLVIIEG
jgi:biotin carboxyl carrier protein